MNDHITVEGRDGAFAAYIARPQSAPAPAVIVLQELFGVNADIRRHCDELAEQGFLAVAPKIVKPNLRLWVLDCDGQPPTVKREARVDVYMRRCGQRSLCSIAVDPYQSARGSLSAPRNVDQRPCPGKYCIG
jgi:hypothetical protein